MTEMSETFYQSAAARVAIVGAGPAGCLAAIALLDAAEARRRPIDVTLYHGGLGSGASRGPLLLDAEALSLLSSFGAPLVGNLAFPLEGIRTRVGREVGVSRRIPLFATRRDGATDFGSSLREMAALLGAGIRERPVDEIHRTPGGFLVRAGGASARAEAVILACGTGPLLSSRIPDHVPPPLWRGCAAELHLDEQARRDLDGWSTLVPGGRNHPDLAVTSEDGRGWLVALGEKVEPSDLAGALLRAVALGLLPTGIQPRNATRIWLPAGTAIPGLPCVGQALGGPPGCWGIADAARQAQEMAAAWFDGGPEAMLEVSRREVRLQAERRKGRALLQPIWKAPGAVEVAVRREKVRHGPQEGPVARVLADHLVPPSTRETSLATRLWALLLLMWAYLLSTLQGSRIPGRALPRQEGRVFVVDDDRDQADAICEFLEGRGIACTAFYDGLNAVAAAGRDRPAAVILDVALPWLDGPTICRALQRQDAIPVYLTTALPLALARQQAAAAGGVKVYSKPLDLQELAIRLGEHVKHQQRPPGPGQRQAGVRISGAGAVQPPA